MPAARAAVVALALLLVHHGVYTISLTCSEIPGLQKNPAVQSLGAFAERLLGSKGLLRRPVSVLSDAIDRAPWGDDVRGFHATNLAIHAFNAVLVTAIAAGFFTALIAVLASLVVSPLVPPTRTCASTASTRAPSRRGGRCPRAAADRPPR